VKRVLLTGASGFIGRQTLAPLRARGFEICPVGRAQGVDLLRPGAAAAAVAEIRPTHLLHLAWYAEHGRFWTAEENLRWVGASLDLLEAFARAGGTRAVVAGTCAEYAWGVDGRCSEATTPLRPATLYGAAKRGLHEVAAAYAAQVGLSLAWGRVFFCFGPHEPPGRLVPSVARALLAGEDAPVTHGEQVRDFLAVEELADAFAALLDSGVEGPVNVASGDPLPMRELVALVAAAAGHPELVRFGAIEPRAGEPAELVAEVRRLRDEVGWRPHEALPERVERAVAWWREELSRAPAAGAASSRRPTATRKSR
jgi:nucleoside-diphosphate-sugar epimerase